MRGRGGMGMGIGIATRASIIMRSAKQIPAAGWSLSAANRMEKEGPVLKKTKIIISDTHIGAGGWSEGNRLEDFISDAEFVAWMHALVDESNRDDVEIDFFINGDWIEFLQIPDALRFEPPRPYETSLYTGVEEAAAVRRLEVVYEWHPGIFLGLADFLNPGPPRRRLHILFGNHDPELIYPRVQARLRQMLNADGRAGRSGADRARRLYEDGVYIEHGNAYVEQVNRFSNPDQPFDPLHPGQIERPNGSSFVTHFFNQLEWERPWVDGVHPVTTLIFYALAFEPAFALKVLKAFLAAAPGMLRDLAAIARSGRAARLGRAAHLLPTVRSGVGAACRPGAGGGDRPAAGGRP